MKKSTILLLLVTCCLASCDKDDEVPAPSGNNPSSKLLKEYIVYDSKDREAEHNYYYYDDKGRKEKIMFFQYGSLYSTYKNYVYTDESTSYEQHYPGDGGTQIGMKVLTLYNAKKYVTDEIMLNSFGDEIQHSYYMRDSNNLVLEITTTSYGQIVQKDKDFIYSNNKYTWNVYKYYADSLLYKVGAEIKYNDKKIQTDYINYVNDSESFHLYYSYDETNRLIGSKTYYYGILESEKLNYEYGDKIDSYITKEYDEGLLVNTTRHKSIYY